MAKRTKTKPDTERTAAGKARMEALTPEKRSEVASIAARARWADKPVRATHAGTLHIGDIEIECAVLPDGRRVVSERAILRALHRPESGASRLTARDGTASESKEILDATPRAVKIGSLIPFIPEGLLSRAMSPVAYTPPVPEGAVASMAKGFPAEALPLICETWLKGRDAGVLTESQIVSAAQADLIIRGLARVGIVALVDEATGYQAKRDKDALQLILDRFLLKELAAWAKKFPDEFYTQIFRLRGWEWKGMKVNRPWIVGKYTKDLVYARLAPELVQEIQRVMPTMKPTGRRRDAWHQLLTDDIGIPALAQHLHAIVGLMRVSKTWAHLLEMVDIAFPRKDDTIALEVMADEAEPVDQKG